MKLWCSGDMSKHSHWSFFCESLKLIWSTYVLSEEKALDAFHVFKNSAILVICFPVFPRELVTCAIVFPLCPAECFPVDHHGV